MKKKKTKAQSPLSKLLSFNKYLLAGVFFLVWIVFLDSRSLVKQRSLDNSISKLTKEIAEMENRYQEELQTQMDLQKDPERYARDNYFMHREDETVFIINKADSGKE